MPQRCMFVCTSNTCRSPMAEAIATSIFPNIAFESRSLSTDYEPEGSPANPTGMCG